MLPPMKALVAFEAAARHQNFTLAAGELHLTHGAVSRQITLLESHFGRPLFIRMARGVALTEAGERLYRTVQKMLAELSALSQALRDDAPTGVVRISLTPSFGSRWLLPRLPRFTEQHPDIEVHFDPSLALVDLARGQYDFAIRYGAGRWKGVEATLLMTETITPLCLPELAEKLGSLDRDRLPLPLLDYSKATLWQHWLAAVDRDCWLENGQLQTVSDYNVLIEAALNGIGIMMGRSALVADLVASGRLVAPFQAQVRSPLSYYLVRVPYPLRKPAAVLWDWLMRESATQAGGAD